MTSAGIAKLLLAPGLLLCAAAALAQVPPPQYNSPRINPIQPRPGENVELLVNWDGCGVPGAVSLQRAGNVITIVQTLDAVCGVPPPDVPPLRYTLGSFAPGQYLVHFSVANTFNSSVFGPLDAPFTVAGNARAIPVLDAAGMAGLSLGLLLAGAWWARRRAVTGHGVQA